MYTTCQLINLVNMDNISNHIHLRPIVLLGPAYKAQMVQCRYKCGSYVHMQHNPNHNGAKMNCLGTNYTHTQTIRTGYCPWDSPKAPHNHKLSPQPCMLSTAFSTPETVNIFNSEDWQCQERYVLIVEASMADTDGLSYKMNFHVKGESQLAVQILTNMHHI